jgi:DNA-binding transcriptional MerR regulator
METFLAVFPDDLQRWRGSAAELADKANQLLPRIGLPSSESGSQVNERLVRYYVQENILSPPDREGRDAMFGVRQVIELLATRHLLKDGWPLAKISELVQASDLSALQDMIPGARPRTPAEEAVARLKVRGVRATDYSRHPPASRLSVGDMGPPASMDLSNSAASPSSSLDLAADISRRRTALQESLRALGNARGQPERRRTVRISLTPWCHVHLDAREMVSMKDETPETLGAALTLALQEERIKKGKQT